MSAYQVLLRIGENGDGDALNVAASVRDGKCVYNSFKRFRNGKETIEDKPCRPSTSRTPEMME